jgi:hypothetical protein
MKTFWNDLKKAKKAVKRVCEPDCAGTKKSDKRIKMETKKSKLYSSLGESCDKLRSSMDASTGIDKKIRYNSGWL